MTPDVCVRPSHVRRAPRLTLADRTDTCRWAAPDRVAALHEQLETAGVKVGDVEDHRPDEDYVTFRCWDPDGTEIEVFWEAP